MYWIDVFQGPRDLPYLAVEINGGEFHPENPMRVRLIELLHAANPPRDQCAARDKNTVIGSHVPFQLRPNQVSLRRGSRVDRIVELFWSVRDLASAFFDSVSKEIDDCT